MNKNIDYNETILEVKNLKTHFRVGTGKNRMKVKAVDDVSFSIHKKEVFGLVGESGCGKTTASRTIIRLYRPTGGDVIFEGHNIGSGHNDFYRNLKYAKINYRIDKLKTNSRKYEIYQIKERFKKEINKIQAKIDVLKEELEEKNVDINKPILEHNAKLFEKKNSFNLEKENLYFKYIHEKTNLKNLTKNEFLIEYKAMKKNIHNLYKIKLDSLKYSEGLDDETRNLQRDFITNEFEQDLAKIDKEFLPKIDERATNLMPKKEYKVLSSKLHADYKKSFASLKEEYKEYLANVDVPNYEAIKKELEILKNDYKELIQKHNEDIKQLKLEAKQEINKLPKKTNIDYDKLKQVKDDYKAYVSIQKEGIRESKTKHYKKEAKLRAQKMQMIFQDPISSLNPRMTVGEIVSEGLVINGEKDKEVLKSKVIDVLELVGLSSEYISRYPHEFSGGQRQRIGIARALIMNPSFIIADEPISALDVSIRAQVLNLLTELKEKLDLTILFIAHDLSVVKFFCDRIAVMFAGKIVEMASSEDLFNYPLHPYTRSLLSAIPHPDPDLEKTRKRTTYSPMMHDYRKDKPELREVKKDHFVYCNEKEYKEILKELGKANA